MSRLATELLFIAITVGAHFIGAAILVGVLVRNNGGRLSDLRGWWPGDDDGRGPAPEPAPRPAPGGGVPLPDAVPAALRVREGERLADVHRLPARRPAEVPAPGEPVREPERV